MSVKKEKGKEATRELHLENSQRGVWLVKVPKYISDRWEKAPPNTEVGKLRIKKKVAGAKPEVNLTLADSICAQVGGLSDMEKNALVRESATGKEIPKEHKFKVSSIAAQTLGVFSHLAGDPEAGVIERLSVEGKVVQRAECNPQQSQLYQAIKAEAIKSAGQPMRTMVRLDKHVKAFKPIANHAANIAHERTKKLEGKKMRDDKDKVQEILFALFEKHQYYNIKDLAKETNQPMSYLREILNEVCVYSVKPPHRNMWELKPEYRHYREEEAEGGAKEPMDSDSD